MQRKNLKKFSLMADIFIAKYSPIAIFFVIFFAIFLFLFIFYCYLFCYFFVFTRCLFVNLFLLAEVSSFLA